MDPIRGARTSNGFLFKVHQDSNLPIEFLPLGTNDTEAFNKNQGDLEMTIQANSFWEGNWDQLVLKQYYTFGVDMHYKIL